MIECVTFWFIEMLQVAVWSAWHWKHLHDPEVVAVVNQAYDEWKAGLFVEMDIEDL